MSEYYILPAVRIEYGEAVDWYLRKSKRAADRFVGEIETAIDAIRRHPQRFARWDETYRFYLLDKFPYFLAYRETAEAIVIVTIRHSSQDQKAWQGR